MTNFSDRRENELDLGLKISPEPYAFKIAAGSSTIREGDALLISFKADGGEWTHVAQKFEKNMLVSTGSRPEHIVVLELREIEAATKISEVSRSVYPEKSFLAIGDPFAFLSLSSPFSVLHVNNDPQKYLELFDLSSVQGRVGSSDRVTDATVESTNLETLNPPVQRTSNPPAHRTSRPADADRGRGEDDDLNQRRRRPTEQDDQSFRTRTDEDPYRRENDVVIPVVIINNDPVVDRDTPGYTPPHSPSTPYDEHDKEISAPFGGDKEEGTAPFGSKESDEATALFGGDREEKSFASHVFGSNEPSAYK